MDKNEIMEENKDIESPDDLLRSVMAQCSKWVDDGSNISIHVTIEHHYHGTIDHLTINGEYAPSNSPE